MSHESLVAIAARKLLLGNAPSVLTATCLTLHKILSNIISDSGNEKKRRLRYANAVVQKKIVAMSGAVEYLCHNCGFEIKKETNDDNAETRVLVLEEVNITILKKCSVWINNILRILSPHCKNLHGAKSNQAVEVLIKLLLPSGDSLFLGFSKNEKLSLLNDIVAAVFFPTFRFNLCTRHPRTVLKEAALQQTFADLKLFPKTLLMVDPIVKTGQAFKNSIPPLQQTALASVRHRKMQTLVDQRAAAKKASQRAKAKAKADKAHRIRVLQEYTSDRDEVARKVEVQKQKRVVEEARKKEQAELLKLQRQKVLSDLTTQGLKESKEMNGN